MHTHTRFYCLHKGRTWMSLSLLSNFLLMGPQTISCFHLSYWFDLWPSQYLSWVQKLKIYRLSQVEEAVKGKKIWARLLWYHLNLERIPSFFVLFKFISTQFCIWPYWQTKLCWQRLSVWSDEVFSFVVSGCSCLWNLKWCCFQAPCFYPSYLLIANFCCFFGCFDWAGRVVDFFGSAVILLIFIIIHRFIPWTGGFTSIK